MSADSPLIYVVACEASGDQIGALMMRAIREEAEGRARFEGIGGPQMRGAGLVSLFDPKDLALLGIFEVLPKAGLVLARVKETLKDIESKQPDIIVTIDSWGFTGRIHQRLSNKGSQIPRVRYVAPQVWAWRPGRAKQLAHWINHLLTLLPFEPPYFTRHGLPATWVGHPVVEIGLDGGNAEAFRNRHNIRADETVIGLLPGSRMGEVARLLPTFLQAVEQAARVQSLNLRLILPTVESMAATVRSILERSGVTNAIVLIGGSERKDAFAACSAALAASGTVSLELAAASVPHVIAYKVNALSALAFRLLAKTSRVNLVNILLNKDAVPERLQSECRADVLAEDLKSLLQDDAIRSVQLADFHSALTQLAPEGTKPSHAAAKKILELINRRQ